VSRFWGIIALSNGCSWLHPRHIQVERRKTVPYNLTLMHTGRVDARFMIFRREGA